MTIKYTLTINADGSTASMRRDDGEPFSTTPVSEVLRSLLAGGLVIEASKPKLEERELTLRYKAGGSDYAWSPDMTAQVVNGLKARIGDGEITVKSQSVRKPRKR